jgi:uncharacterized membrane protein
MKKFFKTFSFFNLIFFLPLIFLSCNYKIVKNNFSKNIVIDDSLIGTVSYAQIKKEVFETKCISCHGNSGGVNLESYPATIQYLAEINSTVFKQHTMPKSPYPRLTKKEYELLKAWIIAGGPEFSINGGPSDEEDEESPLPSIEPSYESIQRNVLDKKCVICHTVNGDAEDLPLVSKDDLLYSSFENLVVPGDPKGSRLMQVLEDYSRRFMPPRRSGISPVTVEEKNAIQVWIQNGAN